MNIIKKMIATLLAVVVTLGLIAYDLNGREHSRVPALNKSFPDTIRVTER